MNTVTVYFDEDGLFGPDPENREGCDVEASKAKYITTLERILKTEYPFADVEVVEKGHFQSSETWPDDFRCDVDEIVFQHWNSWKWAIKAT